MSYEPTNWKTGDVVTSAKLNKLENGVANGGGVLVINDQDGTLDKTYQEIEDAFTNKTPCVVFGNGPMTHTCNFVTAIGIVKDKQGNEYSVEAKITYISNTKDGYPVFTAPQ